jgi:hypothetical protein
LLDWIAEGGPEGLHVHKGRWGKTIHMTSREEREKERVVRVFKNNKKNLQKELMEFGNLQKKFDAILDVYKLPLISESKTH